MGVQLWETLTEAITAYTGLSLSAFFTIIALALAVYYVVSGMFVPGNPNLRARPLEEKREPIVPPVQVGEITEEDLKVYDGSDSMKPLLMAIKGQIYDVSQSRMFYGPGGPYALFAGRDASRALAKMSFEPCDLTGDISGLGPFELEALQDWEYKFMSKYEKVGTIKIVVPVTNGSSSTEDQKHVEGADTDLANHKSAFEVPSATDNDVAKEAVSPKSTGHGSFNNDIAKEAVSPRYAGHGSSDNGVDGVMNE